MKKPARSLFPLVLFLLGWSLSAQDTSLLSCNSFEVQQNQVTFGCDSGAKLALKFLDGRNIRFWFSPDGSFERNNESFAVINEGFDPNYQVQVRENASNFEIFTNELRILVHKSPFRIQIFDKYQRLVLGDMDASYVTKGNGVTTHKVLREDEQQARVGAGSPQPGETEPPSGVDPPVRSEVPLPE